MFIEPTSNYKAYLMSYLRIDRTGKAKMYKPSVQTKPTNAINLAFDLVNQRYAWVLQSPVENLVVISPSVHPRERAFGSSYTVPVSTFEQDFRIETKLWKRINKVANG